MTSIRKVINIVVVMLHDTYLRDIGVRTEVRKTKGNNKLRCSGKKPMFEFADKKAFSDETFRIRVEG